jgi:hypothetical protein
MNWKLFCLIAAIVCFVLAAILIIGDGGLKHQAALIPAGLAFFVASFLLPPSLALRANLSPMTSPVADGQKSIDGKAILDAAGHSVVAPPPPGLGYGSTAGQASLLWLVAQVADEISPWGQQPAVRDYQLRSFFPTESFLCAAVTSIDTRNATFGWKLKGPDKVAQIAHKILQSANQGAGWENFAAKLSLDLYTQDSGAFVEIIHEKASRPDSPVIGIQSLDAQRCWPTGRPEEPVVYLDRDGKFHLMKWWQCVNITEAPSTYELLYGLQYCAMSRVLRACQTERNIEIYEDEKTGGRRTRAIHLVTGVDKDAIEQALNTQQLFSDQQGLSRYAQPAIATGIRPDTPISHEILELTSLPDAWDPEKSMTRYLTVLAMALGVDYGELAPLPGKGLGTGAQSETMAEKSRAKGAGLWMKLVTGLINNFVLPDSVTFEFSDQDLSSELQAAQGSKGRADARAAQIANGELNAATSAKKALDAGDLDQEAYDQAVADYEEAQKKAEEQAQTQADLSAAQQEAIARGDVLPMPVGAKPNPFAKQPSKAPLAKGGDTAVQEGKGDSGGSGSVKSFEEYEQEREGVEGDVAEIVTGGLREFREELKKRLALKERGLVREPAPTPPPAITTIVNGPSNEGMVVTKTLKRDRDGNWQSEEVHTPMRSRS